VREYGEHNVMHAYDKTREEIKSKIALETSWHARNFSSLDRMNVKFWSQRPYKQTKQCEEVWITNECTHHMTNFEEIETRIT